MSATPAFEGLPYNDLLTIDLERSLFVKKKRAAFKAQLIDVYRSEKLTYIGTEQADTPDAAIATVIRKRQNQSTRSAPDY